jgi:hypothetical protein
VMNDYYLPGGTNIGELWIPIPLLSGALISDRLRPVANRPQ